MATVMTYTSTQQKFWLGDCLVDPNNLQLSQGDDARSVEPRVMSVLLCLARRAGDVVLRQEIVEMAWPRGVVVSQHSLTQTIGLLRKSLGDSKGKSKIIQTVPKRGYRLIADPRPVDGHTINEDSLLSGRDSAQEHYSTLEPSSAYEHILTRQDTEESPPKASGIVLLGETTGSMNVDCSAVSLSTHMELNIKDKQAKNGHGISDLNAQHRIGGCPWANDRYMFELALR